MLALNLTDGSFRGSFLDPATGAMLPLHGVVFQATDNAGGYFLDPKSHQSGFLDLEKK